jgi:branched-chain amino acid transport system substrate-binding protein
MSKNIKIILSAVVLVLVVWGLSSVIKNDNNKTPIEKQTVKIGVTLPLTGPVAMLGESVKDAIILAKEQTKNTKYNYELIFEDDAFSPKTAVNTVNKLINIDKVDAIISFGSPVGNVVSPITEKAQITHINDFASDSNVAKGDYNFLHYTPPYKDSELFISELKKRNINTLVFFGQQDNPGANALIQAFEKDIKNTDIKVLSVEKFNTGAKDFKTNILKVKNLGADIYVLEATSPELEILTKQIREAGIKTPVTTMEAFEFSDQLSLFEGMWYVNGADPSQEFVDSYKQKYNIFPKFGAGNGYDAFNLIVKATESTGNGKIKPTSTEIKNALSKIKGFDGVMGKNMSVDSNGQVTSEPVVRIIKGGVPVTIK